MRWFFYILAMLCIAIGTWAWLAQSPWSPIVTTSFTTFGATSNLTMLIFPATPEEYEYIGLRSFIYIVGLFCIGEGTYELLVQGSWLNLANILFTTFGTIGSITSLFFPSIDKNQAQYQYRARSYRARRYQASPNTSHLPFFILGSAALCLLFGWFSTEVIPFLQNNGSVLFNFPYLIYEITGIVMFIALIAIILWRWGINLGDLIMGILSIFSFIIVLILNMILMLFVFACGFSLGMFIVSGFIRGTTQEPVATSEGGLMAGVLVGLIIGIIWVILYLGTKDNPSARPTLIIVGLVSFVLLCIMLYA